LADIGLKPEEVGPSGSATKVTELFMPEAHEQGVIVKGADEAAAVKELASISTQQESYIGGCSHG
jgi:electron transfer flavoprotein alpha/beta subunit